MWQKQKSDKSKTPSFVQETLPNSTITFNTLFNQLYE